MDEPRADVVSEVRRDFAPLESSVAGVFLWGSHAEGTATQRSDVDVCIVGGPGKEVRAVLRLAWTRARLGGRPYDIKVFEELPLFLKAEVLERGVLVLSRDAPGLSEYLRHWRKIWADQAHRHRPSWQDIDRMFAAARQEPGHSRG